MMIAETPPILDGHNDTLLHLYLPERGGSRTFFTRSELGHIDLPRARDGGFAGGFFAVFVPSDPAAPLGDEAEVMRTATGYEVRMAPAIDHVYAQRMTIAMTASLFRLAAESRGQVQVVRTVDELEACLRAGILAAILHFEGAESLDPELDALEVFYQAGLRSLGLVWSRPNAFGHGVPFKFPHSPDTGPGLTAVGRGAVEAGALAPDALAAGFGKAAANRPVDGTAAGRAGGSCFRSTSATGCQSSLPSACTCDPAGSRPSRCQPASVGRSAGPYSTPSGRRTM